MEVKMTIEEKMKRVIELAKKALENNEMPIAAVIFHHDTIISTSYTSERADQRFLVHAELKALLEADQQKYPIKIRKEMQLFTNLEPCMMCLGAAMTFFIGEIYYALEAPMDGATQFAKKFWDKECLEIPAYVTPNIQGGVLRQESIELFKEFAKRNEGKSMYNFAKSLADL